MSIHALPQTTVRAIGSSQVLTDPASVVKELIDNALDARASSIVVEISSNTLDIIQVRDNGHGIAPEDRAMVAKRYCTSKIRDTEDLAAVGGSSLGFRGEALSSAAEMSGGMTIMTRVDGEDVACTLNIARDGQVSSDERASHAVGTTVRITDFLTTQPVRKQVALKATAKCLAKIKHTLQSYAFARPATRLSLRVLKAKSDKDNWTFAPKSSSAGVEDAAMKVVGKACASQCLLVVLENEGFDMAALIPRREADVTKISGCGQYISIDCRPVSSVRGTPKQILKIFKENLKKTDERFDGVKDPFMYLNLTCPAESYDANVEPAKDDVLFEDQQKLIRAVKQLFAQVYPGARPDVLPSDAITRNSGLAGASEAVAPLNSSDSSMSKRQRIFRSNMYGMDDEDAELIDPRPASIALEENDEIQEDVESLPVTNPWVTARMNALGSRSLRRQPQDTLVSTPTRLPCSNEMSSSPVLMQRPNVPSVGLPTPEPSSPAKHWSMMETAVADDRIIGSNRLPLPTLHVMEQPQSSQTRISSPPSELPMFLQTPARESHTARAPPESRPPLVVDHDQGTPLHLIPESVQSRRAPRKQYANKPFVPPMSKERDAWFKPPEMRRDYSRKSRPSQLTQHVSKSSVELVDSPGGHASTRNDTDIRAYLRGAPESASTSHQSDVLIVAEQDENAAPYRQPELTATTAGSPGFVLASELDPRGEEPDPGPPTTAGIARRRTSAKRVLRQTSGNAVVEDVEYIDKTEKPHRRPTTDGELSRLQRTKSANLPLERVPPHARMQNIVINSTLTAAVVQQCMVSSTDMYLDWNAPAINQSSVLQNRVEGTLLADWSANLKSSLAMRFPDEEMVQDLSELLRQAFSAADMLPSSSAGFIV